MPLLSDLGDPCRPSVQGCPADPVDRSHQPVHQHQGCPARPSTRSDPEDRWRPCCPERRSDPSAPSDQVDHRTPADPAGLAPSKPDQPDPCYRCLPSAQRDQARWKRLRSRPCRPSRQPVPLGLADQAPWKRDLPDPWYLPDLSDQVAPRCWSPTPSPRRGPTGTRHRCPHRGTDHRRVHRDLPADRYRA